MEGKFLEVKPSFPAKNRLKCSVLSQTHLLVVMLTGDGTHLLTLLLNPDHLSDLLLNLLLYSVSFQVLFILAPLLAKCMPLTRCLQTMVPRETVLTNGYKCRKSRKTHAEKFIHSLLSLSFLVSIESLPHTGRL